MKSAGDEEINVDDHVQMQQHEDHRAVLSAALAASVSHIDASMLHDTTTATNNASDQLDVAITTTTDHRSAPNVYSYNNRNHYFSDSSDTALFNEFYDDWASFDAAVAHATELHHPIRKRSSLTFDVYNRTVSKGRHDRKTIAEYLSKTFKCTHGIKFRPRGKGRRERHKPRDTGCPFHVYATAVEGENGASYRVKVRQQSQHNHVIGPHALQHATTPPAACDEDDAIEAKGEQQTEEIKLLEPSASAADANVNAAMEAALLVQAQQQAEAIAHAQQLHVEAEAHAAQHALQALHDDAHDNAHVLVIEAAAAAAAAAASDAMLTQAMRVDVHDASVDATPPAPVVEPVIEPVQSPRAKFEPTTTLESIRVQMAAFATERDWNQFHTPRNLVLALTGEVGELCELFQWKPDAAAPVADWSADERAHLGEELSDVLLYLVRLADQCNVDLPAAVAEKLQKNALKYPAELVRGSSKKYNQYKRQRLNDENEDEETNDDNTRQATLDARAFDLTTGSSSSSNTHETARI